MGLTVDDADPVHHGLKVYKKKLKKKAHNQPAHHARPIGHIPLSANPWAHPCQLS